MLFTTYLFIAQFLPAILLMDWLCEIAKQRRARWVALLIGSLVFYAHWRPDHLVVLLGSIVFNYIVGKRIAGGRSGRALLVFGISGNLCLLGAFKYMGFLATNTIWLLNLRGFSVITIALPLGISFFTFTQIAYLVDCAKGRRGEHGPLEYSLFVAFFPHLLAGPIIHHSEMIPQFKRSYRPIDVIATDAAEGLALFAIGASKKLLLADPLAPIVHGVFDTLGSSSTIHPGYAWLGALAYTFQLYFDFSGYSDMAIGLARMFGIRFPANFDSPYRAIDLVDFWRRWHMTLSRWLRDYLYIPLGGNRGGAVARYRNIMITMLLGGLWHGASWNFVVWGGLHGAGLVATHLVHKHLGFLTPRKPAARRALAVSSWGITFLFVAAAWVFFRASTIGGAFRILNEMVHAVVTPQSLAPAFDSAGGLLVALSAAVAFLCPNSLVLERSLATRKASGLLAAALAGAGAAAAVLASMAGPAPSPFLYFTF